MGIFNFFASILGHLLWFLYTIFNNYGLAIIFFTIILKVLLFPMSLKQQRSMAGQGKVSQKQKELQAKYGNNRTKYNEELQKLYEKEGVNPGSGCLVALIPLPIMFAIYYSVIYPLQNTLHIASDKITEATAIVVEVLNLDTTAATSRYVELEIVKNWDILKDQLTMFDAADIAKIELFTEGFDFLGLNLLTSPQNATFFEFLWIIPVLSVLANYFMQFYMNKTSTVKQTGCMKYMLYGMPLLSGYWGFIFPAAVGLYWVVSSVVGGLQSVVMHNFFSPTHLATQKEASRFVLLQQKEGEFKKLPLNKQNEIARRLSERDERVEQKKISANASSKKKNKNNNNNNNYLGNKK